jgi:hypothetical protein
VAFVVIRLRAVRREGRETESAAAPVPPAGPRERGAHRADRSYTDRSYRG